MFTVYTLIALTTLAVTIQADEPWKQHCNGLECPEYTVIQKAKTYELRSYKNMKFAMAGQCGDDYDKATRENFHELFEYISGSNLQQTKIPMTAPVLNVISYHNPNKTLSYLTHFYLPKKFQNNPPKPASQMVHIVNYPAMKVYVRSYPGFSSIKSVQANSNILIEDLKRDNQSFYKGQLLVAGYDSPYKLNHRHNEILIYKI